MVLISWICLTGMGDRPSLVNGPAPPFTLNDLEGRPVNLTDYRGKIVLLNFWANWCEPCKKEMPEMQTAYEQHKDQAFVVLAVNFGGNADQASSFAHHGRLTFPILLDPGVKVAARYGVVSLPISFFIDPNGMIKEQVFGGTLTAESISKAIIRLQGEGKR
jgi:peroxiredoxin